VSRGSLAKSNYRLSIKANCGYNIKATGAIEHLGESQASKHADEFRLFRFPSGTIKQ
jgi:hypothetical protein